MQKGPSLADVSVFIVKKEKQRRGKSTNWRGAKVEPCHSFNLLQQGKSLNFLEYSILACWGRWEGQTSLSSVFGYRHSLVARSQRKKVGNEAKEGQQMFPDGSEALIPPTRSQTYLACLRASPKA